MKNEKKMPREEEKRRRKEEQRIERKKEEDGKVVMYCITRIFQRKCGIECKAVSISA
jgi:hypothetical protein